MKITSQHPMASLRRTRLAIMTSIQIIALCIIGTAGYFLYTYFYQTITKAYEVALLLQVPNLQALNTGRVNAAIDFITQRQVLEKSDTLAPQELPILTVTSSTPNDAIAP